MSVCDLFTWSDIKSLVIVTAAVYIAMPAYNLTEKYFRRIGYCLARRLYEEKEK